MNKEKKRKFEKIKRGNSFGEFRFDINPRMRFRSLRRFFILFRSGWFF
jgi:hypothetical protein